MGKSVKVTCIMPVYNDWESFAILAGRIADIGLEHPAYDFSILAVNDGSLESIPSFPAGIPATVLNLKTNVGHQRAIAIGLQYQFSEGDATDCVIVMDSDGEDIPNNIPQLIQKVESLDNKSIVFAQRKRRQESALFKIGYRFYKILFKILTGQSIGFGNYSVIPANLLKKVVYLNNIWNHYSGSIIQSKIPYDCVLLDRGKRYQGVSKMNFNGLILHGLSSISVYFDTLSLRILRYTAFGIIACFFSVMYILYQKLFTDQAIPGWASSLILILSGIILQLFSVTLIVLLLQLSSRKNITAPNAKIYADFVESVQTNS